ncbi:MAG: acyl-CoA dehydrogenase family protein [Gammaproteobacteria bacterium]
MDLELDQDQVALCQGLDSLLERYADIDPPGTAQYHVGNARLERDLEEGGYFDAARDLGTIGAVLVIEAVAALPWCVEIAASALLRPVLGSEPATRPIALARAPLTTPVRFLAPGATLLVVDGAAVRRLHPAPEQVRAVESPFAYPYALCEGVDPARAPLVDGLAAAELQRLWQIGIAAEIVGAAGRAIDMAVRHVKQRHQFGRPLGSFQVIQHRLSECTVLHRAARLLARKAAWSGDAADAALAAAYAQDAAARVVYETHQFHGAIGLTLEYALHYLTYRLRRLQGELGGTSHQARAAADRRWPLPA